MKVVFFGTGAFGLPALDAIWTRPEFDLCGIVTGADKSQGRGRRPHPTPVAAWAVEKGCTPVFKPERLKDASFVDALRVLNADVFVVVAYRILPESVFTLAAHAFNLHASLLPAYRGAAPIQRAIMAGETRTGVTTFLLRKTVDTGAILAQRELAIEPEETTGELAVRLAELGAGLVTHTLTEIAGGRITTRPQDDALASPAPKILPSDRIISFDDSARDVVNRVRALAPKPAAIATLKGRLVKLLALRDVGSLPRKTNRVPGGTILVADPRDRLSVAIGGRDVEIRTIQPEGKRPQSGVEFVRGYRVRPGDRFESA